MEGDSEAIIAAARANGIAHMLCVCVEMTGLPALLDLVRRHDCLSASVGSHPNAKEEVEPDEDALAAAAGDPAIIAVGETGLDYYRSTGDLDWQRERFRVHIRAARRVKKPLIIHSREARRDVLAILREEGASEVGGIMHCFVDDWDSARAAMDLGFYISFSGIVTFRNAADLQEVAKQVPKDRLLIETDSPYLAPVPRRGKPNQPAWVRHVAEFLAELRSEPLEEIAAATTGNFLRLFPEVRLA
jgi:TatD DNase family protein